LSLEDEFGRLMNELGKNPGRLALVVDGENGEGLVGRLAALADEPVTFVGTVVVQDPLITDESIQTRLSDSSILVDIEILFEPNLEINPIQLLRNLTRRMPRVALWPGQIVGDLASYSELGRGDWYESRLENSIVLRPKPSQFPDEVPYTVERIP
jgi:hypothetical protein